MNGDFEAMVAKYSMELVSQRREWENQGIIKSEPSVAAQAVVTKNDRSTDDDDDKNETSSDEETLDALSDTAVETADYGDTQSEGSLDSSHEDIPENSKLPDDTAVFYARVFTGDSAYPLKGAKVVLRRDGQLVSFLISDKNGETPKVKIPAYPKENSLEPFSENQSLDYLADVYMKGFTTLKDLLVSAVGGTEVVLDVQMTPVPERID